MVKIGPQNHLLVGRRYKPYRSILQTRPQKPWCCPNVQVRHDKDPSLYAHFATMWFYDHMNYRKQTIFQKILRPIVTIIVNWLLVRFFLIQFNLFHSNHFMVYELLYTISQWTVEILNLSILLVTLSNYIWYRKVGFNEITVVIAPVKLQSLGFDPCRDMCEIFCELSKYTVLVGLLHL